MARSADAPMIDWQISDAGKTVVGNDANRFDAWRQSDTFGPMPPTAETGPPETSGGSAPPEASKG